MATTRRGRRVRTALRCIVVLVVWQFGSFLFWAPRAVPQIALSLTPEYTHFERGSTFSWVLLDPSSSPGLDDTQFRRLASLMRHKYADVYLSKADVPEEKIHRDADGRRDGYKGGFSFSFNQEGFGLFWVKVRYSVYIGNVGASGGNHTYIWILGFWVTVRGGPTVMS